MTRCTECSGVLSTKAERCPHCGAKLPKKISLAGWLVLLLFSVFVYQCSMSSVRNDERASAVTPEQMEYQALQQRLSDAKWQCKEFAKQSLKAPATASFQNYNEFSARPNGPGEYVVSGYVDSQNDLGAMLRTNFTCDLKLVGADNWSLSSLVFN
ncbi:MAG: hypothetical protein AB1513_12065 [Pseudomonadota bacterium]